MWEAGRAGVLNERLLCEINQPRGPRPGGDMAWHPDVGGRPGPSAVNRQPYDLVCVCVCVWAGRGLSRE